MKKVSVFVLSLIFVFFGVVLSACGQEPVKDIILSQENVVIYLGETENNSVVVNAMPQNVEVSSLSIFYDNTYIIVSQSPKRADGSFDLTISPNGNKWCEDVEVKILAGANTQKTFLVSVVVPVEEIVVSDGVVVPFDTQAGVRYNLSNITSFLPSETKQTNVVYEILDAGLEGKASIDGNYLVLNADFNVFDKNLNLLVRSEVKSSVTKQFSLKIVPKTDYYVDQISMSRVIAGSEYNLDAEGYVLDIKNGAFVNNFVIRVKIPVALGIDVVVDDMVDSANNIMQYLEVTRVSEPVGEFNVVDFVFESKNLKTGVGYLYFKFFYTQDYGQNLSSRFVVAGSNQNRVMLDKLKVDISVPISAINVSTSCAVDAGGAYVIYNTYNQTVKGSVFVINAVPNNTTEKIVISTIVNVQVYAWSEESRNYINLAEGAEFVSGTTLYVAGASNSSGRIILNEKTEAGATPTITKLLNFAVQTGAVNLGFVKTPENNNTDTTSKKEVFVECGSEEGTLVYLYAPNTTLASIHSSPELRIGYYQETPGNYYTVYVTSNEVGTKDYTIYTDNGFEIYLTVKTIQPIKELSVKIKSDVESPAGVGRYTEFEGSVSDISIKEGYSVPLNFVVNQNANICKIEYSFAEAVLGDETYPSAYSENYLNFTKDSGTFDAYATLISTQNIKDANLITAVKTGKVVIKISVYGYAVTAGEVVVSDEIVKYVCVEVYSPIKQISSSAKVVELRAENQLMDIASTETPKEAVAQVNLGVLASGEKTATYSNLYLKDGQIDKEKGTQTFTYINERFVYSAVLDVATNSLTIILHEIRDGFEGVQATQGIELFAADFYLGNEYLTDESYSLDEVKKHYSTITYTIIVKIVQTTTANDINITSLECKNVQQQNQVVSGVDGEKTILVTVKTYERIYLDVSKAVNGTNTYKILTEVLPLNAYNKELSYTFVPNLNYSKVLVDVSSNDGTIYYSGLEGGTGYIYITPKVLPKSAKTSVKIIIPITVADGNSYETAFEITNLSQINNQSKHYVIVTQNTLELSSPIFNGKDFKGGLYGKRYGDETDTYATIYLNGTSLFDVVGMHAKVSNIMLYGTAFANGFVANENFGTISDVHVTTYIDDGVYIPSLLSAKNTSVKMGGIVGFNNGGRVENCSFAGAIQCMSEDSTNTAESVSPVAVNSDAGVILNCKVIVAKFENVTASKGRLVAVVDGENTYFVNGLLTGTNAQEFAAGDGYTIERGESIDADSCFVKTIAFANGGYKAIGNDTVKYGIVFHFNAKQNAEQTILDGKEYNIISIADLINCNCNIKVLALNMDGTNCSFVSVIGDKIAISGTGEFVLRVYSTHDYTNYQTIRMLSLNYFSEFGIYNGSIKVNDGDLISILKGGKEVVSSAFAALIDGVVIEQNNIEIKFLLNGQDGANYVTGMFAGNHTINAVWEGDNATLLVKLVSGYGTIFDQMLNGAFLNGGLNLELSKKLGTTKIETSADGGKFEPKDSLVFDATITTDIAGDKITDPQSAGGGTIVITNATGVVVTDIFDIFVGQKGEVLTETGKYKFEISIALKDEYRYNVDYVDQTYTVKIMATNSDEDYVYAASVSFALTILPQTLTDVSATLYNITSGDETQTNVSKTETPTSVLKPSGSGLLVLDLYPNFATFDYVKIVAESNTLARLAFRVQKQVDGNPTAYEYDDNAKYEALGDQNGIKINNTFKNQTMAQNIGTYYIMIFATNTLGQDAIFNISVEVYYKDVKLSKSADFVLYIKNPEAPQVSIDGKTTVYAYPGETLVANVNFPQDQRLESAVIKDMNNNVVSDIVVYRSFLGTISGYNVYTLQFTVPDTIYIQEENVHLRLFVESVKIDRGDEEPATSEIQIYLVDFKIDENSFGIRNVLDGTYALSAIKWFDLELYANLLAYYDQDGENSAVNLFKENYYYENYYNTMDENNKKGFVVGNNFGVSASKTLATYLYYVNGDSYAPIARYTGTDVEILTSDWYSNIVSFAFNDGKLQVRGGQSVGEVPMMLQIYYTMPDGVVKVYKQFFSFVNSLYTTEDMPVEITDGAAFIDIPNAETAQDYILANDIYLYEYQTMPDTAKITSLDGNNYTINIVSFARPETTAVKYALFDTVLAGTTIKNVTVNYYYLGELSIADEVTEIKVAGFAITNNGVISNCEVVAVEAGEKTPTHGVYGLKVTTSDTSTADTTVSGFVITNAGSITNSRVGGDEKLVTKYDYSNYTGQNNVNPTLIEQSKTLKLFTIRASGTLSGFVGTNTGVIASSFAKNINVINKYNKNQTKVTTGFVNTNDGTITMSYVEGVKAPSEIQASGGGLEATGIMAGFAYSNNNIISDCYSNIMLHTTNNQVGRLGAGFVYYNAPSGNIKSSYSFSSIAGNNTSQLNFVGITDTMTYNNYGTIKNCYFYITDSMEDVSIETLFNTDVSTVKKVNDSLNFYGFSFAATYSDTFDATWKITATGPSLVSANDIAHSVRFKVDNPNGGNSTLDYVYTYEDKYDYGTANNPIIIRNAKEFNGAFGGYKGTNKEIEDNFRTSTGKIYGSYRLVNNIDLNELIINKDEVSDYKYNLASTAMTLSGEQRVTANRAGSFNGNGLTISNLAISNSPTSGLDNFGMFKSIENGASVSNVNIVLAKGGVKADNTVCVGSLAGSVIDSAIVNVEVKTTGEDEKIEVVGSNIVGGVVGRVVGNSYMFGVSAHNVSALATYYQSENVLVNRIVANTYTREDADNAKLSIAGGVVAVVDIYTADQETSNRNQEDLGMLFANVQGIKAVGGMTVTAFTVGGVFGYVGKYVIAKDVAIELTKTNGNAQLVAYTNGVAGGVIGYNRGFIYQARAEHEANWQKTIENNISKYYSEIDIDTQNVYDRGNATLFNTNIGDVTYKPVAIGGIVGILDNGIINIAYSKVNVINEYAKFAGGVVGYINSNTQNTNSPENQYIAQVIQTYATGDVYAGGKGFAGTGYTGGVIGQSSKDGLVLDKVNALNMWSIETLEKIESNQNLVINQIAQINGVVQNININDLGVFQFDNVNSVTFASGDDYVIDPIKDANKNVITPDGENYITIVPYKEYLGAMVDNGAQIDVAFTQSEWYETLNWLRSATDVYPRIRFTTPSTIYDIYDRNDFYKFRDYGANPDAKFVVRAEQPIDCKGHQTTYSVLAGSIIGMHSNSGFKNLSVPLFKKANNATISSLVFETTSAPLVEVSEGTTKFKNIIYNNCSFAKAKYTTESAGEKIASYAGVTYEAGPSVEFNGIEFNNCAILAGKPSTNYTANAEVYSSNVGLLFAKSRSSATSSHSTTINAIKVVGLSMIYRYFAENNNIGVLFGKSDPVVAVRNINIENVAIDIIIEANKDQPTVTKESRIGIVGGYAGGANVTKILLNNNGIKVSGGNIGDDVDNIYVGGMFGEVQNELSYTDKSVEEQNETKDVYVDTKIISDCTQDNVYVGGLAGKVGKLSYDLSSNLVVGQSENMVESITVHVSKNTYVGGLVGKGGASFINLATRQAQYTDGFIMYNGNIVLEQKQKVDGDVSESTTGDAYVGGIFGIMESSDAGNMSFGGTINFKGTAKKANTYYVGGIAGLIEKLNQNATLTNVYSIGEILLNGKLGKLITSDTTSYVGGFAGAVGKQSTAVGLDLVDCYSLTTIYNLNEKTSGTKNDINVKVDAIATKANGSTITGGTYVSALNLCTGTSGTNAMYKDIIELVPSKLKTFYQSEKGTKLNPVTYLPSMAEENLESYTIVADNDEQKITISGPKDEIYSSEPPAGAKGGYAKAYVYVNTENTYDLERQITLQNAIMFSDGGIIYSEITPFDIIDSHSAVSGIIARVDIDGNKEKSEGGFVNINNGIIYTSSVQETYVHFQNKLDPSIRTKFYGYLNVTSGAQYVGGFAGINNGYIFGSNTNININVAGVTTTVGAFAGQNKGTIDYCYASGYVSLTSDGGLHNLDIFANKEERTSSTKYANATNCYTIFADLAYADENGAISNAFNVLYETESIENENLTSGKIVYGTTSNVSDSKGYYNVNENYNNYYPTLSGGAFAGIEYLKRSTQVVLVSGTSEDSGLVSTFYYYDLPEDIEGVDSENIYNVIINIVTLKNVNGGENNDSKNNYVFARSLSMGVVNGGSGLIPREYDYGTIDGYKNGLINGNISSYIIKGLGGNGTITNLKIQGLTISGKARGVIETNNGTISHCQVVGSVSAATNAESLGVLVGTNFGEIRNTTISAKITLYGSTTNYSFGAVAGVSDGGKISSATLSAAHIYANEESDRASIIKVGGIVGTAKNTTINGCGLLDSKIYASSKETTYVGGIVGFVEGNANITNCYIDTHVAGESVQAIKTIIIGGSEEKTTIKASLNDASSNNLQPDSNDTDTSENTTTPDTLTSDSNKVEYATNASYVGGIVGFVASGTPTIKDCSTFARVIARAVWHATTGDGARKDTAYKYDSGLIYVYREMTSNANAGGICSNYITGLNTNYKGLLFSEPEAGKDLQAFYVDTKQDLPVGNLANFGTVSGGYTAWKPIARLDGTGKRTNATIWGGNLNQAIGQVGALAGTAGVMGAMALKAGLIAAASTNPIGWVALGIVGVVTIVMGIQQSNQGAAQRAEAIRNLQTVDIYYDMYDGNGAHQLAYNDAETAGNVNSENITVINIQHLNYVLERSVYSSGWVDVTEDFTNKKQSATLYGEYDLQYCGKFIKNTTKLKEYKSASGSYLYYNDAKIIYEPSNGNYSHVNVVTGDDSSDYKAISEIKYDSIAPTLSGCYGSGQSSSCIIKADEKWAYQQYYVYSSTDNYKTTIDSKHAEVKTLRTANPLNAGLQFRAKNKLNINWDGDNTTSSISQTNSASAYEYVIYTPCNINILEGRYLSQQSTLKFEGGNWNSQGEHTVSLPQALYFEDLVNEDGNVYKHLKFTDPTKWRNLVYTINSGVVVNAEGEIVSSDSTNNPFHGENVVIDIDVPGQIYVGSNIIDKFNGTINVSKTAGTVFTGMNLYLSETTTNAGLIRFSSSAKLNNVRYSGEIGIIYSEEQESTNTNQIGVLIGTVDSDVDSLVELVDCSVNISDIICSTYKTTAKILAEDVSIDESSFAKVSAFGGLVGGVNSKLSIKKSQSVIGEGNGKITINTNALGFGAGTLTGFGGMVGVVNEGAQATINNTYTSINYLNILSDISAVGGLVGNNQGTLNVNGNVSVDIAKLYMVSSANAYVGGIVGFSSYAVNISDSLIINSNVERAIISADTLNGQSSVYAGGVIGFVESTCNISAILNIGGTTADEYVDICYIYAGNNMYTLREGMCAIPSSAGAGYIFGNNSGLILDNARVNGVVVKAVSIKNNYIDSDFAEFGASSIGLTSGVEGFVTNKTANSYKVGSYEFFSVNGDQVTTGTSKTDSEYWNISEIEYLVESGTSKMSDISASTINEYIITFINRTELKMPGITTDGEGKTVINENEDALTEFSSEVVIKYFVRIIPLAKNLTSANEYMIQVILLNSDEISNFNPDSSDPNLNKIDGTVDQGVKNGKLNVVYTYKTDLDGISDGIEVEISDIATKSLNSLRTITNSKSVDDGNKKITIDNYTYGWFGEDLAGLPHETKLVLKISSNSISLVEKANLYKQTSIYTYASQDSEPQHDSDSDSESVSTVEIELFKCNLEKVSTYEFAAESAIVSGGTAGENQDLGALVDGEYGNIVIEEGFVQENEKEIWYNNVKAVSSNWYSGTINGHDYRILSVVCGEGEMDQVSGIYSAYNYVEFVFEKQGENLYYIGKMMYTLSGKGLTGQENFDDRYQSLMPDVGSLATGIDGVSIRNVYYALSVDRLSSAQLNGVAVVSTNGETKTKYALKLFGGGIAIDGEGESLEVSIQNIASRVAVQDAPATDSKLSLTINGETNSYDYTKAYYYGGVVIGYQQTTTTLPDADGNFTTTTKYYYVNSVGGQYTAIVESENPLTFTALVQN